MRIKPVQSTSPSWNAGCPTCLLPIVISGSVSSLPEIRNIFSKYGCNLGETNSVSWMFEREGYFVVEGSNITEDDLIEAALEAGADDVQKDGDSFEVTTEPHQFEAVRDALGEKKIPTVVSEIKMLPKNTVKAGGSTAKKVLNFIEILEDHEDVQHVWANFDIDISELES